MRILALLAVSLYGVSAYPGVGMAAKRMAAPEPDWDHPAFDVVKRVDGETPAVAASKAEGNCGLVPCVTFSEDQLVTGTGQYAYASPLTHQIRGPCPGLNAAANHGYLPRSGVSDFQHTTLGLTQMYGFGPEFGAALNAFSSIISGDILTQTWSIGGPQPFTQLPGSLLTPPQGISYAHNKYEGDVSIGRSDAYTANGDAHSLNTTHLLRAYQFGLKDDRFTMDKYRKAFQLNQDYSISHNPYYFSPPLAGAIVAPGAYYFVINFMSNHTADQPNGYLDMNTFNSFFAVTGKYPNFVWKKGQERIPPNWYRRPLDNPYGAANFGAEFPLTYAAYPKSLRIGGNTNGVNTYKGADIDTLTGGQFTSLGDLAKGNNLACLAFQAQLQVIPDELHGTTNKAAAALKLFSKAFAPIFKKLKCAPLDKYDGTVFNQFTGASYNPTGPATNY